MGARMADEKIPRQPASDLAITIDVGRRLVRVHAWRCLNNGYSGRQLYRSFKRHSGSRRTHRGDHVGA